MLVPRLKALLKKAALVGLGSAPVVMGKWATIRAAGVVTILNLHRVQEHDRSTYPPLDPRLFEELLRFVTAHFTLVTFGTVSEAAGPGDKPPLILSFDDGYRDFHDVALPILGRHGIRVNQNVIPGCIESGLPPLNVLLQDFVGQAPESLVLDLEVPGFRIDRTLPRSTLGGRLSAFLKGKPQAEQAALQRHLLPQLERFAEFRPTPMMSLEQVREVARSHELGAHSFHHASMGVETDEYLVEDVRQCRGYFEEHLRLPLTIYAFPNGSHRPAQIPLVRHEGIEHVLLVGEDFSPRGTQIHRRFTFDARSHHELRFRVTGAFRWPPLRAVV